MPKQPSLIHEVAPTSDIVASIAVDAARVLAHLPNRSASTTTDGTELAEEAILSCSHAEFLAALPVQDGMAC